MHRTTITLKYKLLQKHCTTLLNKIDPTRFTSNQLLTRDHDKLLKHISNYLLNLTTFRKNNEMYKESLYIAVAALFAILLNINNSINKDGRHQMTLKNRYLLGFTRILESAISLVVHSSPNLIGVTYKAARLPVHRDR